MESNPLHVLRDNHDVWIESIHLPVPERYLNGNSYSDSLPLTNDGKSDRHPYTKMPVPGDVAYDIIREAWNGDVETIRRSYIDALRLQERIDALIGDLNESMSDAWSSGEKRYVSAIADAMQRQADSNGAETKVGHTLPTPLHDVRNFPASYWEPLWKPDTDYATFVYHIPDLIPKPEFYTDDSWPPPTHDEPFVLDLFSERIGQSSLLLSHAEPHHTWGELVASCEERLADLEKRSTRWTRKWSLLTFRRSVLSNALWQFEAFGWLDRWEDKPDSQTAGADIQQQKHLPTKDETLRTILVNSSLRLRWLYNLSVSGDIDSTGPNLFARLEEEWKRLGLHETEGETPYGSGKVLRNRLTEWMKRGNP